MIKSVRDKWIKALRSGRYKQTTGRLRKKINGKYRYCCLGVLCKINRLNFRTCTIKGHIADKIATEKFGLSYKEQTRLSTLNDIDRLTFKQIADEIEAVL